MKHEHKRKSHRKQKFLVILALAIFQVMVWQLDLWCSPAIYANPHFLLVAFGFGMANTLAYDIAIGFEYIAVGILIGALWFWD